MSNNKEYNKSIYDEINHKINSMDSVRNSRIQSSKRLYHYSDHWGIISLLMNIIAVTSTILSLLDFPINTQNINIFLSSIFSIYTIIIQYYVANLNYNERALRFEYQQLGIERFVLELKTILIERTSYEELDTNISEDNRNKVNYAKTSEAIKKYESIMQRYQELLVGYENHNDSDRNIGNKIYENYTNRKTFSFLHEKDGSSSIDKKMIIFQYLIIGLYIIVYLYIFFIN